ncbi:MAG: biopolymer transporter ExbD [Ignavibacteriae bacterium]|nr:biopolymer transporter ExbD [Ignavibacteriota bacterium]
MKFKAEQKHLSVFAFSSLTDIVLLLLIFFLLSSSFVIQPGIKVQLPKSETGEVDTKREAIISLTEQGGMYLNNEQVTTETLGAKLSKFLGENKDRVVVVNADKTVNLQSVVQVLDIAKGVGASRFLIATQPTQ